MTKDFQRKHEKSDCLRGREEAQRLWIEGILDEIENEPRSEEFAESALEELEDVQDKTPGILREVLKGAQMSADQLNIDPFQGVIEVLQNADDLGATHLRIGFKKRRDSDRLLMVHNGKPVQLPHVIAMAYAFISTKRSDSRAKGRFGIGLKTLGSLGSTLRVHCHPYHFKIQDNRISKTKPATDIDNFYSCQSEETLLELQLDCEFDPLMFSKWFSGLGARLLIFLDTVNSVELIDFKNKISSQRYAIERKHLDAISLPRLKEECKRLSIKDAQTSTKWMRYEIDRTLPGKLKRRHKASGKTTPIAIAVAIKGEHKSELFAGLPLNYPINLPFSINAHFEVSTDRRALRQDSFNEWLIQRAADLCASVALYQLGSLRSLGWKFVPLLKEGKIANDCWLSDRLEALSNTVQKRVRESGHLFLEYVERHLREFCYGENDLIREIITRSDALMIKPGNVLLPEQIVDKDGRWRAVLEELDVCPIITVSDVMMMLDWPDEELGIRDVQWYIRLFCAALDQGLENDFYHQRSVITKDERRIEPPAPDVDGMYLVRSLDHSSLAHQFNLVDEIHPHYLTRWHRARTARKALEDDGILRDSPIAEATLRSLANQSKRIYLNDSQLKQVRDLIEKVSLDNSDENLPPVGEVIEIDLYEWKDGKKHLCKGSPSEAYLPASLDEKDRWATAAGKTPGLKWIDPRYEKVLRRSKNIDGMRSRRHLIGARKFFSLLGAMTSPRLLEPPDEEFKDRYNSRAWKIRKEQLSGEQLQELDDLSSFLQGEFRSPDLIAVLTNLAKERKKATCHERIQALFKVMDKHWPEIYGAHLEATLVSPYRGWNEVKMIPSHWISAARGLKWLRNEKGRCKSPDELALKTPSNEAIYGNNSFQYVRDLDRSYFDSPFLKALNIGTEVEVSELIEELTHLARNKESPNENRIRLIYTAIAAKIPKKIQNQDESIGDLTLRKIRSLFDKRKLVFVSENWFRPSDIFLGPDIFEGKRPFQSARSHEANLWKALNVSEPDVGDCLEVLNEISKSPMNKEDEQTLVNIYHFIEDRLGDRKSSRNRFEEMPLWTGRKWERKRPLYVTDDNDITDDLSKKLPVWQLPILTATIPNLIRLCSVTLIDDSAIEAIYKEDMIGQDDELSDRFHTAVGLLHDNLARGDAKLAGKLKLNWSDFKNAEIGIDPNLRAKVRIKRNYRKVRTRGLLLRNPVRLFFDDESSIGAESTGCRLVANLFNTMDKTERLLITNTWYKCWNESVEKPDVGLLHTVEDNQPNESLEKLLEQASMSGIQPHKVIKKKTPSLGKITSEFSETQIVRKLKSIDELRKKNVTLIPGRDLASGRRSIGLRSVVPSGSQIEKTPQAPRYAPKEYDNQMLEHWALQALNVAINGDYSDLRDFRHLRGVGADAMDNLKRAFEIKSFARKIPSTIKLTANEWMRATKDQGNFYLAIVGGIEEGYDTILRIIQDPISTLEPTNSSSVILRGVRDCKAIEVILEA